MSADWRRLSRESGLKPEGHTISVAFGDGRRQTVTIDDSRDDAVRIWSTVAKPSVVNQLDDPLVSAWLRNRLSELVGFAIDKRGRMIGETWIPLTGLNPREWSLLVHNLARSTDRFEYLLTGRDEE